MKLRVGIVGIGAHWESRHLPALAALSDRYEVRAICDSVWHRAERTARQLGAHVVGGFRALTARHDVDAVLFLSSQLYGSLPIHAACEHGKAIYCAAGLDVCQETARRIRNRVREAGIAFLAEFRCRHAASTLRLKELIATRLGAPRLIFAERRDLIPAAPASSQGGRENQDLGRIDWCRFVVGRDPAAVLGIVQGGQAEDDPRTYSFVHLDFAASAEAPAVLAQIRFGQCFPAAWKEAASFRVPADFQVVCEQGVAFVDLPNRITWFDDAGQHSENLEGERPVDQRLLLDFHRSVTSLILNDSNLQDAYRAICIAHAAAESARLGRRLPLVLDD